MTKKPVLKAMEFYDCLKEVEDKDEVMAIVATVLDKWAADNDFTIEQADEMFKTFAVVGVIKHSEVGLPKKTPDVAWEAIRKMIGKEETDGIKR